MRVVIVVIIALLAIIFVGGYLNVGNGTIFQHMDSVLHTNVFMALHYSLFYFLHRAEDSAAAEFSRIKSDLNEFEKKPAGIDKWGYRRKIDEASK